MFVAVVYMEEVEGSKVIGPFDTREEAETQGKQLTELLDEMYDDSGMPFREHDYYVTELHATAQEGLSNTAPPSMGKMWGGKQ